MCMRPPGTGMENTKENSPTFLSQHPGPLKRGRDCRGTDCSSLSKTFPTGLMAHINPDSFSHSKKSHNGSFKLILITTTMNKYI